MKRHLLVGGSLLLFAAFPAWPQAAPGLAEISGTVRDSSGSVIPGAQVVISNEARGVHLTLTTSGSGVFDAPALAPAAGYEVAVSRTGFSNYDVKDINLEVGHNVNIVAALEVAGTATTVSVQATAPLVDDTKTDVSQVIGTQQIMDLPINGRRVDSFVLLTPGVTNDGAYGLLTFRGVANGNTFLLDGNDSTEQFYGENNGRTRVISQISQDAVQEFEVVSANFSAQYGNAMGGVVNTITKSGTNDLHGSAFWFYRDGAMIAHDPYANINPDEWRVQAGFTFGGSIVRNKLFYFLNGDFTRRNYPIVDTYVKSGTINPTTETFIGCGTPSGTTPAATPAQCAAINALLPRFFGLVPRDMAQDIGLGRLDYRLDDRNTFSASLNYMHFNAPNGLENTLIASTTGQGVNSNGNDYSRVRNGKFTWTSVLTPNLINEFRYGWNTDLEGDNLNPSLNGSLGLLDVSAGGVTLGAINYLPRVEPNETRNEFSDNLTWVHGRHIVKFGYDVESTNDYSYYITNLNGSYTYGSVNSFALDFSGNTTGAKDWQTFSQTFGRPALNTRITTFGSYGEDQWKVTSKLTATIGLRYEYSVLPQPSLCNPVFPGTCHINSPGNEIMPRIGLAYRLNDKTVVRAGYGIFYSRVMGATLQDLFEGNGVTTKSISLSGSNASQQALGPVFPNILSAGTVAPSTLQFAAPNWKVPYSEQGLFAVERAIGKDISVTASYIWSRGVQLYGERDLNLPAPSSTYTYTIDDQNGNQMGTYTTPIFTNPRPNPAYGAIIQDENGVESFYDAFTFQLNKRFSYGLQGLLSYTWSHEYDDGQGYGQATQNIYLSSASAWLNNGNYRTEFGDGLEDQPQRLAISWVWTPTFTHSPSAFAKYFVNNWQLASVTTINSRRPYGSPTIFTNVSAVSNMIGFNISGNSLSSRVPFWGVDSVWQPANFRADFRLTKMIPIRERYRLDLNFEVFNISNSWSPTSMTTEAFVENTKGVLTLNAGGYGVGSSDTLNPDGTMARRLQVSARFSF